MRALALLIFVLFVSCYLGETHGSPRDKERKGEPEKPPTKPPRPTKRPRTTKAPKRTTSSTTSSIASDTETLLTTTQASPLTPSEPIVTTEEVVTSPQTTMSSNKTTTPAHTSTPSPNPSCLPGESYFLKSDLQLIIKHIDMKELQAANKINQTLHPGLEEVLEKLKDLENLKNIYSERPEHLVHVIKNFATKRLQLEQYIKKINEDMGKHDAVFESYTKLIKSYNELINRFQKCEYLCKANCESYENDGTTTEAIHSTDFYEQDEIAIRYFKTFRNDHEEDYYCGKVDEIHKEVITSIEIFINTTILELNDFIQSATEDMHIQINEFKSKIKETALESFGQTMYDTLNMLDQYFHFENDVKAVPPVEKFMKTLKRRINYLENRIDELEDNITNTSVRCVLYCKHAPRDFKIRLFQNSHPEHFEDDNFYDTTTIKNDSPKDLLAILLKTYQTNLKELLKYYFSNIFESLAERVKSDNINDFIQDLKPIESEIKQALNEERNYLENLQNLFNNNNVRKMISMKQNLEDVEQRLNDVSSTLEKIDKSIPKRL